MAGQKEHQDQKQLLLDFFIHAPIGMLYEFSDLYPEAVKRGKSQVQIGKLLAKVAADKGKDNLENSIEDFVRESAGFLSIIAERLEKIYEEPKGSTTDTKTRSKSQPTKSGSAKKKPVKKKTVAKKKPVKKKTVANKKSAKKKTAAKKKSS